MTGAADLAAALSRLRRELVVAERAAADAVEDIDPSFPRWHQTGPPRDPAGPLAAALARLDELVAMRRAVVEMAVALEAEARVARHERKKGADDE